MIDRLVSLRQHAGFMKYFKNTSWLFAEKMLRMVVGLFVGVWVARYLGPEQFGSYSYAISFVGLFATVATLGLDNILLRELIKDEGARDRLLGTVFFLKTVGAVAVLLLLAAAVPLTSNDAYTNAMIFAIAGATVFQSFNVIDLYFQSRVLSRFVVYANVITLLLSSVIKIALILLGAPLIAFALVILLDSVVLASGMLYFYRRHVDSWKRWTFDRLLARRLLRDSWPLVFSGIVVSIYMKIDQVMIKEMLDSEAVGLYAAAAKLSLAWYVVPGVILSSIFPAIANAKNRNGALYQKRLQHLYDLMVWIAVAAALPMTFFAEPLISLLYGNAYDQSATVLAIHIWSAVFVFQGLAFGKYLILENLTKKSLYRTSAGAVANVILNLLLIPAFGINGAAVATLISQFVVNYGYDIFDRDLRPSLWMKVRSFLPLHYITKGRM